MEVVFKSSVKETTMTCFQHMMRILKLDGTVFNALAPTRLPMRYTMLNVSLLGLIFGMETEEIFGRIVSASSISVLAAVSTLRWLRLWWMRFGKARTCWTPPWALTWPIVPISAVYEKFYPRNINHMSPVKFFESLDNDPIGLFLDRH